MDASGDGVVDVVDGRFVIVDAPFDIYLIFILSYENFQVFNNKIMMKIIAVT